MGLSLPKFSVPTVSQITNTVARSDIGKAAGVVTNPLRTPVDAAKHLMRGDIKGAAGSYFAGVMSNAPMSRLINSSSSIENLFKNNKTINNLSFGLASDSVDATNAYNDLQNNGHISGDQWKDILVYNAKAGALVAGGTYAASNGYLAKAGSYALENPVQSALLAKMYSKGDYSGAITSLVPELSGILPPPIVDRTTPVDTSNNGGSLSAVDNFTIEAIDTKTKLALGAALLFVIAIIFKKMRN